MREPIRLLDAQPEFFTEDADPVLASLDCVDESGNVATRLHASPIGRPIRAVESAFDGDLAHVMKLQMKFCRYRFMRDSQTGEDRNRILLPIAQLRPSVRQSRSLPKVDDRVAPDSKFSGDR
jgi:hypothetical protein